MEDNWIALLACILSDTEVGIILHRMGFQNAIGGYAKKNHRTDKTYEEWQRRVNEGATYKQIAAENGISHKTVCQLLLNWRRKNENNPNITRSLPYRVRSTAGIS